MNWRDECYEALVSAKMFEDTSHQNRFKELIDCYGNYPFFTPGLCKCIYLSAWDEEHFCIMLETLTELALGHEPTTKEMRIKGDALEEETDAEDSYIYNLSNAFLDDRPFTAPEPENLSSHTKYIVRRALMAAAIIDSI